MVLIQKLQRLSVFTLMIGIGVLGLKDLIAFPSKVNGGEPFSEVVATGVLIAGKSQVVAIE